MAEKKYVDADYLIEGRVSNDNIVIAVKCAPAADVVEAVRCKDCLYYYGAACIHPRNVAPFRTEGNDYCSRGERKKYEW